LHIASDAINELFFRIAALISLKKFNSSIFYHALMKTAISSRLVGEMRLF